MTSLVQYDYGCQQSIAVERIVEKVGFEPAVKECESDGCWEWWRRQRWLDRRTRKWVVIGEADKMNLEVDSKVVGCL